MIRRRMPADPFQEGVYSILTTHDLGVPVYDHVPGDAALPYVTFGDYEWTRIENKSADYGQAMLEIHVWSSQSGKMQVNQIADDIAALLTSWPLSVSGFNVMDQDVNRCRAFETETNGYHGIVSFVAKIQNQGG